MVDYYFVIAGGLFSIFLAGGMYVAFTSLRNGLTVDTDEMIDSLKSFLIVSIFWPIVFPLFIIFATCAVSKWLIGKGWERFVEVASRPGTTETPEELVVIPQETSSVDPFEIISLRLENSRLMAENATLRNLLSGSPPSGSPANDQEIPSDAPPEAPGHRLMDLS